MKVQSSENKLVNTEEFIFDQNKLPSDPNNHFKTLVHAILDTSWKQMAAEIQQFYFSYKIMFTL